MGQEPFRIRFLLAWQAYERRVGRKVDGQAFAAALGVSRPSVSAWQQAESPPPHDRVLSIAQVTGVDAGWLAYGRAQDALPADGEPAVLRRTRGRLIDEDSAAREAASESATGKRGRKRRA